MGDTSTEVEPVRKRRRPVRRYRRRAFVCKVIAGIVGVSFCMAVLFSKFTWGYFLFRPHVFKEIHDIAVVSALIPLDTEAQDDGSRRTVAQENYSIRDELSEGRDDPYYCLDERLLFPLKERGLLPSRTSSDLSNLPDVFPLIEGTGILAAPERGYESADLLEGVLIDSIAESGERLVFIGVEGAQVSNDHFPYYELLFAQRSGSPEFRYVRGQRFYFDRAGIEGIEWYVLWPYFTFVGLGIWFLAWMLWVLSRKVLDRFSRTCDTGAKAS